MSGEEQAEVRLDLSDHEALRTLLGPNDVHLRLLSSELGVRMRLKGQTLVVKGQPEQAKLGAVVARQLYDLIAQGYPIYELDIEFAARILSSDPKASLKEIFLDRIYLQGRKRIITPRSLTQKLYLEAIREHDIVMGIGPAGTGKTYLAMAMATEALLKGQVERIVMARPAVEAGEKLGFLPGDLAEKVNPYLRPLYDALHDMMDFDKAARLMGKGVIEVAPLAFMRGRTLNSSFVILDEAQNTTSEQMKMFLTRLGYDSQAVITGDVTQVDLPNGTTSGLVQARRILQSVKGIAIVDFKDTDVVRHRLVRDIIRAYEKEDNNASEDMRLHTAG